MDQLAQILIPPLEEPLTYLVPKELATTIEIGCRVAVPLGRRKAAGYVISQGPADDSVQREYAVKPISASRENQRCFAPEQLRFFEWVAEYYGDTVSNVIDVAVPPMAPPKETRLVELVEGYRGPVRGKNQQALIEALRQESTPVAYEALRRRVSGAAGALSRLSELGAVRIKTSLARDWNDNEPIPEWASKFVELNLQQREAFNRIMAALSRGAPHTFLLHGVTGSGKTEVYIDAIQAAREQGKGVLVVVPEIALTPQLVDRFRGRLGSGIAVLHSGLQRRNRWDAWTALLNGKCHIALGARSAVFAPVPNLGLIIVDEEHDGSFKQSEGLRYHARDLAVLRGQLHSCPVVLGSATPSLESLWNAQRGKYTTLSLPARPSSSAPVTVSIVDLNRLKPWEMASRHVSPELHSQISEVLERGEQVFILYNRRGFASYLQCEACEEVVSCPNCSVSLTLHRELRTLLCHYCGLSMVIPDHCLACEQRNVAQQRRTEPRPLLERGAGTERVFDELVSLFPTTQIARLDRDAVHDIEHYREILDAVRSGETKILVGTQMIAKGHDLPNVTLVGVVDCDVGLHMPDFRAGEKAFQLLTQVAGRAGRSSKGGHVILQTRVPQHPAIVATAGHNYEQFAQRELASRRQLGYPPYSRLLRVVASSTEQTLPGDALHKLRRAAQQWGESESLELVFLGPSPCPLTRLKALWRWHMLVKSGSTKSLVKLMKFLLPAEKKIKGVKLIMDIDPQEML